MSKQRASRVRASTGNQNTFAKPVPSTAPLLKRSLLHVARHAENVTTTTANKYQAVDKHIVGGVKRVVPPRIKKAISKRVTVHDSSVAICVSRPEKRPPRHIRFSRKLAYVRHAIAPGLVVMALLAYVLVGATPVTYLATNVLSGAGSESGLKVDVDGSGNTYTTGTFEGTVNFAADWGGTDNKTASSGNTNVYITKINSNGTYGWTKIIDNGTSWAEAKMTVANDGTVYVAGNFEGTVNFAADWGGTDSATNTTYKEWFVTKINSNGTYGDTWHFHATGDSYAEFYVHDMDTDSANNVLMTGKFSNEVIFDSPFGGSSDTKTASSGYDSYLAKINSNGTYGWTHHIATQTYDLYGNITVDSSDNIYIAGSSFSGSVNFAAPWGGTDTKVNYASNPLFVTKVNANNTYGWTRVIGSALTDSGSVAPNALAVDEAGNVYLSGSFTQTVNFAEDWGSSDDKTYVGGYHDAFLTKVNANNTYGWTHTIGTNEYENIWGISVTADNIFLAGGYTDTTNFAASWGGTDSKTLFGNTSSNGFFTTLTSAGGYDNTKVLELGASTTAMIGSMKESQGEIYLTGYYEGTVDFAADFGDTDEKTSSGYDSFVMGLSSSETLYTITDAAGITFKDENGVNLSSVGTSAPDPLVHVYTEADVLLATVAADLTENRDWSSAAGDASTETNKMYIRDIIGAPGADTALALYVPRETNDAAVTLCPGANTLEDVSPNCTGKVTYTDNDAGVSTELIESQSYWKVEGVDNTDIGAMSMAFPGVSIIETSGSTAVTEGGTTDTVSIQLNAAPTHDVDVTLTAAPSGQLASFDPVTFTSANWSTPVAVDVEAIDDATIEGAASISIGYSTVSSDPNYDDTSESSMLDVDITDNDVASMSWQNSDNLTDEAGDTAEICVELTAEPSDNVTLGLESSDVSEVTVPADITITPGDWNADTNCFIATGVDDSLTDGAIDADISVSGVTSDDSNFSAINTSSLGTVQISNQDNDTAAITLDVTDDESTEAGASAEVCVTLTAQPVSGNVTIPVSVTDATEGTLSSVTEIIVAAADWNTGECVTVSGVNDDLDDGDIAYQLATGDPTATDGSWDVLDASDVADADLTNVDDDTAVVQVSEPGGATTVVEGGAADTIEVALASQPAPGNEVVLAITPNTQVDIGNGAGQPDTLTFTDANWSTPQVLTVSAVNDAAVEGAHSGSVHMQVDEATTEPTYDGVTIDSVAVAITDNDTAIASIETVSDALENPETDGIARVTLSSLNQTGDDITLSYSVGGSAVANTQYDALPGTAVIASGEDTVDIPLSVIGYDNALLQGSKTVVITLTASDSVSATISETDDAASISIFDDETAEVSVVTAQDGNEAGPQDIVFSATMSDVNNTGQPITVDINQFGGTATPGDDFTPLTGQTITIANGSNTGSHTVTVNDDDVFEPMTESLQAQIDAPSIPQVSIDLDNDTAAATITDNDTAALTISATDATATENPSENGTITVSLDTQNDTGDVIEVDYSVTGTATADEDYTVLSGSVAIADGQSSGTATIDTSTFNDDDMEGDETVVLTYETNSLASRVDAPAPDNATVTITDDETAAVTVSTPDNTTSESGGTGQVCFELASRPNADVTIALSASDADQINVPASVTVTRSNWNTASENCITVTGQDDLPPVVSGTQEVVVLTGDVTSSDSFYDALSSGDVADASLDHADNDSPAVQIQAVGTTTSEDGSQTATLEFRLTSQPASSVTVALSVSDATEGSLSATEVVIAPEDWDQYSANQITISGVDDDLTDGDINFDIITGDVTSSDSFYDALSSGDVANQQFTNEDDDTAEVVISETSGNTAVAEGGATDTVNVVLATQPAPGNEVVVSLGASSQLDLGVGNGQPVEKTFTSATWNTPQSVTITADDDSAVEGDHVADISLAIDQESTTEAAYDAVSIDPVSVAITDNDIATASLSTVYNAAENPASNGRFRVTLDAENNTGQPLSFSYSVAGSAVADTHYEALSGSVAVPDGQTSADIEVNVDGYDNALLEGAKMVDMLLTESDSPHAAIDAEADTATVSISDDETAVVTLTATQNGQETGPTAALFTAMLSTVNNTGQPITVVLDPTGGTAEAASDYTDFADTTISVADGADTGVAVITVLDDTLFEAATETVQATISQPSLVQVTIDSENDTDTATITDNDAASLSVNATDDVAAENPADDGTISLVLDKTNNTGADITVEYVVSGAAAANQDYAALSGNTTIPNGQTTASLTVATDSYDDDDMEGNETVVVTYDATDLAERITAGVSADTVTIADDETASVIISTPDDTTDEDGDTAELCFRLASRPSANVTIALSSSDPTKVTIPASVTVQRDDWDDAVASCVLATGQNDTPPAVTGTEQVVIVTGDVTSADTFYENIGGEAVADVTLDHLDNDSPGITTQLVSGTTSEDGTQTATVRYRLTTQPTDAVVIPLSVSDETEGSLGGVTELSIDPANWNDPSANEITVSGVDDSLIDGDVPYTLITGDPTSNDASYSALNANDVTNSALTNEDNDTAGVTIAESDNATAVSEAGLTDTQSVVLVTQPASGNDVVITATPLDTNIDIGNGAGVPIELTFEHDDWNVPQEVTIAALDDALLETNHESQVSYAINTLSTSEQAYKDYEGDLPAFSVAVTDNDTASVDLSMTAGAEAGPTSLGVTVALSKTNNTGENITVSVSSSGGTATSGADYAVFDDTTIVVPSGQDTAQVDVAVLDDSLFEGDETVAATIAEPSIAEVTLGQASETVVITDNDTAAATIVATDATASENPSTGGAFTVYLSRTNNTGTAVNLTYSISGTATTGADYIALSGEVSIPSGESTATIALDTTDKNDDEVEGNETVTGTLTSIDHPLASIGNPNAATVIIADDDAFAASIDSVEDGSEAGPAAMVFTISLSNINTTGSPITMDIAVADGSTAWSDSDYEAIADQASIAHGQQSVNITVPVIDDDALESMETLGLTISNVSEGDVAVATATATITDNDTATLHVSANDAAAAENPADNGQFTIFLSKMNQGVNPLLISYTVNGTGTSGQDYAAVSGSAMIAAGQSDTVVNIDTSGFDDSSFEGDETVSVTLSSTNNSAVSIVSPSTAIVTITDDDPVPSTSTTPLTPLVTTPINQSTSENVTTDETAVPEPQPVDQADVDVDRDSLSNNEEAKAHNNGDGNGDGIPDAQQANVASHISSVTKRPVTLEVLGVCQTVQKFQVVAEASATKPDARYRYPYGLVDYTLGCTAKKQAAAVTIYYDEQLADAVEWRKLTATTDRYKKLELAALLSQPVGRQAVTTVQYRVVDGGEDDDDRRVNGVIRDPAGLAVRTFYAPDIGWMVLVVVASWFVGYGAYHRVKYYHKIR